MISKFIQLVNKKLRQLLAKFVQTGLRIVQKIWYLQATVERVLLG